MGRVKKVCARVGCNSTIIWGRCPDCYRPLCAQHQGYGGCRNHIDKGGPPVSGKRTTLTVTPEEVGPPVAIRCWLCEQDDRWVYWGLATSGIDYPGPTRFICDDCVQKVKAL